MSTTRTRRSFGLAGARWLATLILGLACQDTGAASASEGEIVREFTLSTDPTVEILNIQYLGSWSVEVALYGDGRLALAQVNREDVRLSRRERDQLVGELVDAGLMEFDGEEFKARLASRAPLPYAALESASIGVTLRLESYRGPRQDSGPAAMVVAIASPRFLIKHFPDVREIQALVFLLDVIDRHRARAPQKRRHE